MERNLFVFTALILVACSGYAQNYKLEYNITCTGDEVQFYGSINYTTSKSKQAYVTSLPKNGGTIRRIVTIPASDGYIKTIRLDNGYILGHSIFGWNRPNSGQGNFTYNYSNYMNEFEKSESRSYTAQYKDYISIPILLGIPLPVPITSTYNYNIVYNLKFYPDISIVSKPQFLHTETKCNICFNPLAELI